MGRYALWRSLPAKWYTSLLLQALCAGYNDQSSARGYKRTGAQRNGGTYPCTGRIGGYVQQMRISNSTIQRAKRSGNPVIDGNRATFIWEGKTAPYLMSDFNDWDEKSK